MNPEVRVAYNDGFDARTLRLLLQEVAARRLQIADCRLNGDGMNSSVEAVAVRWDEDRMWVDLSDGRTLGVPLAWFPRLLNADPHQRVACRISRRGLHWEDLDEDISVAGLLAGLGDQTRPLQAVA